MENNNSNKMNLENGSTVKRLYESYDQCMDWKSENQVCINHCPKGDVLVILIK